jgi:hypothetical protein
MAHDEHYANKIMDRLLLNRGSKRLAKRMGELDPAKTIIALGNYGYDWAEGQNAEEVSFQKAVIDARESEAKNR